MERLALLAATLCYLFSFGHTLFLLGAGRFRPGRFNVLAMALGAASQTWYLALRGMAEHACPVGTLTETLIFLGWSVAMIYLLIGPSYRLSLMGAFTAPLVLLLQLAALLVPEAPPISSPPNPLVEAHAALSLVAFGAFGLAAISGIMFLVQERQLKSRRPSPIFHHLPPISVLQVVTLRILCLGLFVLTLSFAAGHRAHLAVAETKFLFSVLIWLLYLALIVTAKLGLLTGRRFAMAVTLTFLLALGLLPVIQYFSTKSPASLATMFLNHAQLPPVSDLPTSSSQLPTRCEYPLRRT